MDARDSGGAEGCAIHHMAEQMHAADAFVYDPAVGRKESNAAEGLCQDLPETLSAGVEFFDEGGVYRFRIIGHGHIRTFSTDQADSFEAGQMVKS